MVKKTARAPILPVLYSTVSYTAKGQGRPPLAILISHFVTGIIPVLFATLAAPRTIFFATHEATRTTLTLSVSIAYLPESGSANSSAGLSAIST